VKLKLKDRRQLSLEEMWEIEDKYFPGACGPSPLSYAARYGLTLSKRYLEHLRRQQANGNGARNTRSRRRKTTVA
jgi:hypothetical protein